MAGSEPDRGYHFPGIRAEHRQTRLFLHVFLAIVEVVGQSAFIRELSEGSLVDLDRPAPVLGVDAGARSLMPVGHRVVRQVSRPSDTLRVAFGVNVHRTLPVLPCRSEASGLHPSWTLLQVKFLASSLFFTRSLLASMAANPSAYFPAF